MKYTPITKILLLLFVATNTFFPPNVSWAQKEKADDSATIAVYLSPVKSDISLAFLFKNSSNGDLQVGQPGTAQAPITILKPNGETIKIATDFDYTDGHPPSLKPGGNEVAILEVPELLNYMGEKQMEGVYHISWNVMVPNTKQVFQSNEVLVVVPGNVKKQ